MLVWLTDGRSAHLILKDEAFATIRIVGELSNRMIPLAQLSTRADVRDDLRSGKIVRKS
jgi:hypothetical protein